MSVSELSGIINDNLGAGRLTRIPFLPAAFPGREEFWTILADLAAHGADIIEIGVPFTDPVADGPQVVEAGRQALANGGGLDYIFEGLARRRHKLSRGLVLMGYVNPFIQYGWRRAALKFRGPREIMAASLAFLAEKMSQAGVAGLIAPDLPLEESALWLKALRPRGLDLIALVGPNTSLEKMRAYADGGFGGYVYVVSVLGTTGLRGDLPPEAAETLKRARKAFDLPLALGFGLSSPAQLESLPERPAAAVFGSALIRHLAGGGTVRDFMAPWLT